MTLFVGLDVSLRLTAVCVVTQAGEPVWQGKVLSDPADVLACLEPWRSELGLVGLEAGPLSEWLYAGLVEAGLEARCLDTRHTQRFLSTRPNKTDRNDARGIAEMMRLGHFRPVHVKSGASQRVRALIVSRGALVNAIGSLENTVRGIVRVFGIKLGRGGRAGFAARVRELVNHDLAVYAAVNPMLEARDALRVQKLKLDRAFQRMAKADPICRRLMTVPGVGPIISAAYKATIDDPGRFSSSKAVGAHLGLTPRIYQSGEMDRSGGISKCGDRMLRHLLFEAATMLMTRAGRWSRLKAWGVQVAKRSGVRKARVAVARKLATIMHWMWVREEEFRFGEGRDAALQAY